MAKRLSLIVLLVLVAQSSWAATLRVDPSGGPYTNLQAAFTAALGGDSILLAPGSYTGPENRGLVFGDRDLTVLAEDGRSETVIDLQNEGQAFILNDHQSPASLIQGLVFEHGDATQGGAVLLFNASATLRRCVFRANAAAQGGGLFVQGFGEPGMVEDCLFLGNEAGFGGGIYANGINSPDIRDCVFDSNSADFGGGIYLSNFASPEIHGCWIEDNTALQNGGGLFIQINSSPLVSGCTLVGNSCNLYGGGAYVFQSAEPIFTLNTFALNEASQGGCIYLFLNANATVEQNCFAWSGSGGVMTCAGSTPSVTHNLSWEAGTGEPYCQSDIGNLAADPRFCGVIGNRDFRLRSDSPCLPGHPDNSFGLHIGAWPEACGPEAVVDSDWSRVKTRY